MSGEKLVKKFRELGVPGAEELDGRTFDWLFLKTDSEGEREPAAIFLEWFMDNITPNNVLTEEEITEYEALEAAGETLSLSELQDMEGVLTSMPVHPGSSQQGVGKNFVPSPEELQALRDELKVLTHRKNMLSAHKLEVCSKTSKLTDQLQKAQSELMGELEKASSISFQCSQAQEKLAAIVDAQIDTFRKFGDTSVDEPVFMSQVNLEEWHRQEDKFTDLLKAYTQKQFRESMGADDSSKTVLLEGKDEDLSLVCGMTEEQYRNNNAELSRLSDLLPRTEEWRLRGLREQARRKAEIEEAEKCLALLLQGNFPRDINVIKQQTAEAQESLAVVERERREQERVLHSAVAESTELQRLKVINADYDRQLLYQQYMTSKQKIVLDEVVSQAARHNWVLIALQMDGQTASNKLDVLKKINQTITDRHNDYTHRMEALEALQRKADDDKASCVLPPPLQTLSRLLPEPRQGKVRAGLGDREVLVKQLEDVMSGKISAEQQIASWESPQFSSLSQMMNICEVLEESVFGNVGSLQPLPLAWLEDSLARRCTQNEQKLWQFKQKLISVMAEYEKKKKILQNDPTLQEKQRKWISDVSGKLS